MVIAGENTAFGCFDEREEFTDFREIRHFLFCLSNGIGHAFAMAEEDVVQIFDRPDRFRGETIPAHTDDIETAYTAVPPVTDHERR